MNCNCDMINIAICVSSNTADVKYLVFFLCLRMGLCNKVHWTHCNGSKYKSYEP